MDFDRLKPWELKAKGDDFRKEGRLADAIDAYIKGWDDDHLNISLRSEMSYNVAQCYFKLRMYEESLDWAEWALRNGGNNDRYLRCIGESMAYLRQFAEARTSINEIEDDELRHDKLEFIEALE